MEVEEVSQDTDNKDTIVEVSDTVSECVCVHVYTMYIEIYIFIYMEKNQNTENQQ